MREIGYGEAAWACETDGATRALRAHVARGYLERLLGLIGTAEAPEGCALVFGRCGCVHTFWMPYAIDVLWLMRPDESGRMAVLRADRDVARGRVLRGPGGAWAAAEMAAGSLGEEAPASLVVASMARAGRKGR